MLCIRINCLTSLGARRWLRVVGHFENYNVLFRLEFDVFFK